MLKFWTIFPLFFVLLLTTLLVWQNSLDDTQYLTSNAFASSASPDQYSTKYDAGFYNKIQNLISNQLQTDGAIGSSDSNATQTYSLLLIADRGNPPSDAIATQSKQTIVSILEFCDAQNIYSASLLSFVTADVPLSCIADLAASDAVYIVGDGLLELNVLPSVSVASGASGSVASGAANVSITLTPELNAINWSDSSSVYDGTGVKVSIIDGGINSTLLNSKVKKQVYCFNVSSGCSTDAPKISSFHGTSISGIIAASKSGHNYTGIAPGVDLLDVFFSGDRNGVTKNVIFAKDLAYGLMWSLNNGADVANISTNITFDNIQICNQGRSINFVVEESVTLGITVVVSAGNEGFDDGSLIFQSITPPACANNVISVGGMETRNLNGTLIDDASYKLRNASSKGPTFDVVLKPELIAPSYGIPVICFISDDLCSDKLINSDLDDDIAFFPDKGTSLAAPMVSAASAILLDANPRYTPLEIKSALLLGAKWLGHVPCTSAQYEINFISPCSHADMPTATNLLLSNDTISLNQVGFGLLDITNALHYTKALQSDGDIHIERNTIRANTVNNHYFTVSDTDTEPIKIILSWLVKPAGNIVSQANRNDAPIHADIDMNIILPNNTVIHINSVKQTNEFIVFDPPMPGRYTVVVTSDLSETYVLASTQPLTGMRTMSYTALSSIILNGAKTVTVELGSTYTEIGARANGNSNIMPSGTVNTNVAGIYVLEYSATDTAGNPLLPAKRIVKVIDDVTPPVITLIGNSIITIPQRSQYVDQGAKTDDGSEVIPSGSVNTDVVGTYTITYNAIDLAGNNALPVSRTVIVTESTLPPPPPSNQITLFTDNFEYATLSLTDKWIETGDGNWKVTTSDAEGVSTLQDHEPSNRVLHLDNCDDICILTLKAPISLLGYESATLEFSRFVDGELTADDYLRVELYDGTSWNEIYYWADGRGDDGMWNNESFTMPSTYLNTDNFKIRFTAKANLHDEDIQIDNIFINVISSGTTTPPPPPSPPPPPPPPPPDTVSFSNNFESDSLTTNWAATGENNWAIVTQSLKHLQLPNHPDDNKVLRANDCDRPCTLTLKNSIDLTEYRPSATLSFSRFIDRSLDDHEHLKVELYDGDRWNTLYHWSEDRGSDDGTWHDESYDLTSYLDVSDFKIRFVTQQNRVSENVQIDNIKIVPTSSGGGGAPPTDIQVLADFDSGLTGWRNSGDEDWISSLAHISNPVPMSSALNKVLFSQDCDSRCIITSSPIDLSQRGTSYLVLDRFISSKVDPGEYLRVDLYDGSRWQTAFDWQASSGDNDNIWHTDSVSLSSKYLVSDMKIRMTAQSDRHSEIMMIDNIKVQDTNPNPVDDTPPVISGARNINVVLDNVNRGPITYTNPTAKDLVDGTITVTCNPQTGSVFRAGTTTVNCSASDMAGNTATASFVVNVISRDTVPPVVNAPSNRVFEATNILTPITRSQIGTATATDALDSSPTITNNAPTSFPLGNTVITWTATDDNRNRDSERQTITVRDTTPPVIRNLGSIVMEAISSHSFVRLSNPTVLDIFPVTITNNAPVSFPVGTTVITWIATDTSGNSASITQNVIIRDTMPPQIEALRDTTFEATGVLTPLDEGDYGTPSVTDLSDVTITNNAPASFPLGNTVITWTATDSTGNSAVISSTVTVRDTIPPTISTIPSTLTVEATAIQTPVSLDTPTASDLADSNVTVSSNSTGFFTVGTHTIVWTATDDSGNTASTVQTITIQDSTPPTFTYTPSNILLESNNNGTQTRATFDLPIASDLVDSHVTVLCTPPSTSVFPIGSTIVSCTAQDSSGNTAVASFTVTVAILADTPPRITAPASKIFVTANQSITISAQSLGLPQVTDNADTNPTITNNAPTSFPVGATKIVWTATDSAGNSATAIQWILVYDNVAPSLTVKPVITVNATEQITHLDVTSNRGAQYTDNTVAGGPQPQIHLDNYLFELGNHTSEWTITDSSGNIAQLGQDIIIQNQTVVTPNLIFYDTFDTSIGSWIQHRYSPNTLPDDPCDPAPTSLYGAKHSSQYGGSVQLYREHDCGITASVMYKVVQIPDTFDGDTFRLVMDHKHVLDDPQSHVVYFVFSKANGQVLGSAPINTHGSMDLRGNHWQTTNIESFSFDTDFCPCLVQIYRFDRGDHESPLYTYVDNVRVAMTPAVPSGPSGSSGSSSSSITNTPNLLTTDELFQFISESLAYNKIIISAKYMDIDSIGIKWDPVKGANQYTVSAWPSSNPDSITTHDVLASNDLQYTFVGLEHDTEYMVTVQVTGDDSTRTVVSISSLDEVYGATGEGGGATGN